MSGFPSSCSVVIFFYFLALRAEMTTSMASSVSTQQKRASVKNRCACREKAKSIVCKAHHTLLLPFQVPLSCLPSRCRSPRGWSSWTGGFIQLLALHLAHAKVFFPQASVFLADDVDHYCGHRWSRRKNLWLQTSFNVHLGPASSSFKLVYLWVLVHEVTRLWYKYRFTPILLENPVKCTHKDIREVLQKVIWV